MKMKQVYISYNGCCFVQGPANKLAIFRSQKNRTNYVTDHTKALISHLIRRLLSKSQIKWQIVSNFCGLFRMSQLYYLIE